jgi:tetratricopeptide (TPR) repeat protein
LAFGYFDAGQYRQAERLFGELIQESSADSDVPLPEIKCNLAIVYIEQARYEEAEQLLLEALSSETAWWQRRYSWQKKPYTEHLAEVYLCQSRYELAEQLLKERKKENAPNGVVYSMHCLGRLYMIQKRYDEAEEEFTNGIEAGRRTLPGKENPSTLRNINGLAVLRTKQKQYEEAKRLFDEVLEARKRKLGEEHPHTLETKNDLAVLYKEQGLYDDAELLLLEALEGRRLKLGDEHPRTLESWNHLIELYEAWNKPEKVNQWRTKLLQTEAKDE